jgi:hypothetical protein
MYNERTGSTSTASREVQEVFTGNTLVQRAMGYNHEMDDCVSYPYDLNIKINKSDKLPIPREFHNPHDHLLLTQVARLKVSKHDTLQQGVYIVVSKSLSFSLNAALMHNADCIAKIERNSKHLVGKIQSIWVKKSPGASN